METYGGYPSTKRVSIQATRDSSHSRGNRPKTYGITGPVIESARETVMLAARSNLRKILPQSTNNGRNNQQNTPTRTSMSRPQSAGEIEKLKYMPQNNSRPFEYCSNVARKHGLPPLFSQDFPREQTHPNQVETGNRFGRNQLNTGAVKTCTTPRQQARKCFPLNNPQPHIGDTAGLVGSSEKQNAAAKPNCCHFHGNQQNSNSCSNKVKPCKHNNCGPKCNSNDGFIKPGQQTIIEVYSPKAPTVSGCNKTVQPIDRSVSYEDDFIPYDTEDYFFCSQQTISNHSIVISNAVDVLNNNVSIQQAKNPGNYNVKNNSPNVTNETCNNRKNLTKCGENSQRYSITGKEKSILQLKKNISAKKSCTDMPGRKEPETKRVTQVKKLSLDKKNNLKTTSSTKSGRHSCHESDLIKVPDENDVLRTFTVTNEDTIVITPGMPTLIEFHSSKNLNDKLSFKTHQNVQTPALLPGSNSNASSLNEELIGCDIIDNLFINNSLSYDTDSDNPADHRKKKPETEQNNKREGFCRNPSCKYNDNRKIQSDNLQRGCTRRACLVKRENAQKKTETHRKSFDNFEVQDIKTTENHPFTKRQHEQHHHEVTQDTGVFHNIQYQGQQMQNQPYPPLPMPLYQCPKQVQNQPYQGSQYPGPPPHNHQSSAPPYPPPPMPYQWNQIHTPPITVNHMMQPPYPFYSPSQQQYPSPPKPYANYNVFNDPRMRYSDQGRGDQYGNVLLPSNNRWSRNADTALESDFSSNFPHSSLRQNICDQNCCY